MDVAFLCIFYCQVGNAVYEQFHCRLDALQSMNGPEVVSVADGLLRVDEQSLGAVEVLVVRRWRGIDDPAGLFAAIKAAGIVNPLRLSARQDGVDAAWLPFDGAL